MIKHTLGRTAKAVGQLASSLAEATDSDMGMVILVHKDHVGVFLGGSDKEYSDQKQMVKQMRRIALHLNTLADSVLTGETKCDGQFYGMDQNGKVTPLKDMKPSSSSEPDISMLQ